MATLAKKVYFKNYYPAIVDKETNRYIYEVGRDTDLDVRRSFYGGRCDIYGFGKFDKVYYYDFTSLYPSMGKHMLPIGAP
jgi:hypothetical protein